MKNPVFFIIGAFKGGNKTLRYYLDNHPDVFMNPVEESRYFSYMGRNINYKGPGDKKFNREKITSLEKYKGLFNSAPKYSIIGDASSIYFYGPEIPARIKSLFPDAKIIICLKNPVERAFSNYIQKIRNREEFIMDFNSALLEEKKRKEMNYSPAWFYIQKGFYSHLLMNYYRVFKREQISVYLFEDIINNTNEILDDLYRFLGISQFEQNPGIKIDETFLPKNNLIFSLTKKRWKLYRLLKKVLPPGYSNLFINYLNDLSEKNKVYPVLPEGIRVKLKEIYREDILKTQDIVNINLSNWLK